MEPPADPARTMLGIEPARALSRRAGKSPAAFRTISEVAGDLDVPPHVLRFWESRFNQIKPLKRGGGRRYYRPEDVDLLRTIRELLYTEGYTIRGVQKLLRESGAKSPPRTAEESPPPSAPAPSGERTAPAEDGTRAALRGVLGDLRALRERLAALAGDRTPAPGAPMNQDRPLP